MASVGDGDEPPRKRRRGPHACSLCRQRKVRCDGQQPCSNCVTSNNDCTYSADPAAKGKSDAILETVLRLDDKLSHLSGLLTSGNTYGVSDGTTNAPFSPRTIASTGPSLLQNSRQLVRDHRNDERRLENAALSSQHTSTTESVLAWSYFDTDATLRTQYQPIFLLEQQRRSLAEYAIEDTPILEAEEVYEIVQAFQSVVNFSYPTVSMVQLQGVVQRITQKQLDASIESCYALLVMGLGCACQVVETLPHVQSQPEDHRDKKLLRSRDLALVYFGLVVKRFHVMQLEVSTTATQCLFFTALFFAYLQRPLQAWSHINMAAAKCRLLLSYTSADAGADTECLRRIFWSCYVLESDYVAELAALPQSGIADIESSIPLPGSYLTSDHDIERDQSSLYFLACISMRRLLNRVHDLLYAPDPTGVGFDDARFPHIVTELDHQLEDWRECLPPAFRFTIDTQAAQSPAGGFLRQRYLTCRAVIYRPYLNQILGKFANGEGLSAPVLDNSAVCLNMCLLHILNLQSFRQTVLVDTWICSLSMSSTMLLLLAASRIPELKDRLYPRVLRTGSHLSSLVGPWLELHGEQISPSAEQSLRMISDIDELLHKEFWAAD